MLNVHPTRMALTPGAQELLLRHGVNPADLIRRHLKGDWGDCDTHDAKENDRAVKAGDRTLGVYNIGNNKTVWVIADAALDTENSVTAEGHTFQPGERYALTVLLPEDY